MAEGPPAASGSDNWRRMAGILRGVDNNPFWRFSRPVYALSPDIVLRHEPAWVPEATAYDVTTGQLRFYDPATYAVLAELETPRTVEALAGLLADKGLAFEAGALQGRLEEAVRDGALVAGALPQVKARLARRRRHPVSQAPVAHTSFGTPFPSAPYNVNLYLTFRCNMNCKHCGVVRRGDVAGELDGRAWREVFGELEQAGIHTLVLNGGEPSLHPDFLDILQDLARRPFRVYLFSNASGLGREAIDVLSRADNFILSLSVDGPEAAIHDDFRETPGSFDHLMRVCGALREGSPHTPFIFASLIHKDSVGRLADMPPLAIERGALGVAFLQMNYMGRAQKTGYYVSLAERPEILRAVFDLGEEYQDRLMITMQGREPGLKDMPPLNDYFGHELVCACGITDMAISPDGGAYLCEAAFSLPPARGVPFCVGDVRRDGFLGAWRSAGWEVGRGGATRDDLSACPSCRLYESCSMKRCRIYALVSGGDLRGCPSECRRQAERLGIE